MAKDYDQAVSWFRKAAEQGDPNGQVGLGVSYLMGRGVPQDDSEAVTWYRKAAEQGNTNAQVFMGLRYCGGEGVRQDYAEAVKWFRKAADQGDAIAEYNLGVAFRAGSGVPKNCEEAMKWFRMGAERGNPVAQCVLGIEYFNGSTVARDYVESSKWVNLALSQAKAADFLKCTDLIPPPVNPPKVQINGVDLSPGQHATAKTRFGTVAIKCVSVEKETAKVLVDGEDAPRTLRMSGPTDVRSRLLQAALELRTKIEQRIGVKAQAATGDPSTKPGNPAPARDSASPTTAKTLPPLIMHGPSAYDHNPRQNIPPVAPTQPAVVAGSGFFVSDDGFLVTCEHVVHGAAHFSVKSVSASLPAKLVRKDKTLDLALLKVEGAFRALPVARQPSVKLGEAVFTIGFPNPDVQGVEPKLTRGEISSMAGLSDNPRYFQISVPVQPGNSGGALVDECGNVVGVVTARLDDIATYKISGALPQNVNYAVKGGAVYNFLSSVPELSGKIKAPRSGRDREAASSAAERAAVLVVAE